jgi:hypothetical protein
VESGVGNQTGVDAAVERAADDGGGVYVHTSTHSLRCVCCEL